MSSKRAILYIHAAGAAVPTTEAKDSTDDVTVLSSDGLLSIAGNENLYDEIKMKSILPDDNMQEVLFKILKPSCKVLIEDVPDRATGQALALDLKIQGFVDILAAKDPLSSDRFVVCQKPAWEMGSSAAVNIPRSIEAGQIESKVSSEGESGGKKWKMAAMDLADDDLIDENELLDDGFKAPDVATGGAGCGEMVGGKRRACKDCTCGLAEATDADATALNQNSTVEEKLVRSSACGNCAKGDAFRCASCPFLGKPAFEPGNERVVLAMADDI